MLLKMYDVSGKDFYAMKRMYINSFDCVRVKVGEK